MKKLCALLRIKLFSQQDDTKIVNFDEGVLIQSVSFPYLPFYLRNLNLRTENFPLCGFPG